MKLERDSGRTDAVGFHSYEVPAAAAAKSLQSCPTSSNPMDCSLPGSSIYGIFQARVLETGAIAISYEVPRGVKLKRQKVKLVSRVRLLATPWTAPYQAPPPMGFSRQEYRLLQIYTHNQ